MTSAELSLYERKQWDALIVHWEKKANRKKWVPAPVRRAAGRAGRKVVEGAQWTGEFISEHTPDGVKNKLEHGGDKYLKPTVVAVAQMIELVNDWVIELTDTKKVIAFHQERGRPVEVIEDIRKLDLKDADEMVRGMVLKWRSIGAGEGAALGALACIPVAGGAA